MQSEQNIPIYGNDIKSDESKGLLTNNHDTRCCCCLCSCDRKLVIISRLYVLLFCILFSFGLYFLCTISHIDNSNYDKTICRVSKNATIDFNVLNVPIEYDVQNMTNCHGILKIENSPLHRELYVPMHRFICAVHKYGCDYVSLDYPNILILNYSKIVFGIIFILGSFCVIYIEDLKKCIKNICC